MNFHVFRELDHICFVNDISVAEMDQRSVIEMLKNSHHLKLVIKRRLNTDKIHEIALPTNTGWIFLYKWKV